MRRPDISRELPLELGNARALTHPSTAKHLTGDRRLMLRHAVVKGARLNETDARRVLQHLADLWSYDVSLVEVDATGNVLKEYIVNPRGLAAAA